MGDATGARFYVCLPGSMCAHRCLSLSWSLFAISGLRVTDDTPLVLGGNGNSQDGQWPLCVLPVFRFTRADLHLRL